MTSVRTRFLLLCAGLLTTSGYGTHLPPALTLSPDRIDFGSQSVGSSSQPATVTLTNTSNSRIGIRDITASGVDFRESTDCQENLGPGKSCTVTIIFTPAITGVRTGVLSISDSTGNPRYVALSGNGT